jgi:nucleoside-diphosphate-sugar epimerase
MITILGFGAVGRAIAALLTARGAQAQVAQRSAPKSLPVGVSFATCDILVRDHVIAACKGASTVVLAAGLSHRASVWQHAWPTAMSNALEACALSNAWLVFTDNLYTYGPHEGRLREDLPLTAYGQKPKVRAEITRLWQAAHAAGRVRATAVRASDFYGSDVKTSVLGEFGIKLLSEGKSAFLLHDPDQPHDFTYVPDFARATVSLIDAPDDAYGQAWHVPNAPPRTPLQILTRAAELIGVKPRIRTMPRFLRPIAGYVSADLRELAELRYQTDRP